MSAQTAAERKRKQRALDRDDPNRKNRKLDVLFMFGSVEVAIIKDLSGQIWFRGVDLAKALDMKNYSAAIYEHVDNQHTQSYSEISKNIQKYQNIPGIQPTTTFVNEEGMNLFIIRSHMPKAEEFSRWVCGTVLPSIRKTGSYVLPTSEDNPYKELNEFLKQQNNELKLEIKQLQLKNDVLTTRLFELKPSCIFPLANELKAEYFVLYRKFRLDDTSTVNYTHPYYVCRVQMESLDERRHQLLEKYPKLIQLLQFKVPNSVNFYNYIKENLRHIVKQDHHNKNNMRLVQALNGILSPNYQALENEMLAAIQSIYNCSQ